MNWNQKDLICEFEILKDKFEDLLSMETYFDEDYFCYNGKHILTKDETVTHGMKYHEHRIHQSQVIDLMMMYQKRFDDLIENFKALDIEKSATDESLATESDNA